MAAPKENLPSSGLLTGTEWNTFTKQKHHCVTNSVNRPMLSHADLSNLQRHQSVTVVQLQQRWQELKERELRAQQHNKELLQHFEKAQDALKEMLACTAAMKTIRMEYEQYLEESSPRWQKQLKEKTQVVQRMRMGDEMRSQLKTREDAEMSNSYADQHLNSQGFIKPLLKTTETQIKNSQMTHPDYSQHVHSSWLTHPQSQTARFYQRESHLPQSSSYVPPSSFPNPHPFMLHHPASISSYQPPPRQNPTGWAWTAGAAGFPEGLWGLLQTQEPRPESTVSQAAAPEAEKSTASSSSSERCGSRSRGLSQELDIKPVRLSSGPAESSESSRDSSHQIRERKKQKKSFKTHPSNKECHSSKESSRSSSAIIIASIAAAQGSENDASSRKCSTSESKKKRKRSESQASGSLTIEKVVKEKTRSKEEGSVTQCASEESEKQTDVSTSQNAGNMNVDRKPGRCRKESEDICRHRKNTAEDKIKTREDSSSEQSSTEEDHDNLEGEKGFSLGDDEPDQRSVEDKNNNHCKSQKEEKQEEDNEEKDGEVFARNKTEEEEETGAEDEMEEQEDEGELKSEDCEKESSASSQDEEEEKTDEEEEEGSDEEDDGESEEEEEQGKDKAREPEDSEDSIISPQRNKTHNVTNEAAEDDDHTEKMGTTAGLSDGGDSNDSSLRKQEMKDKTDLNAVQKPKAGTDMKIFEAEDGSTKSCHLSDSDEFDHFYD